MKISILIPTYNGEETLRELFAVLHYQTVQPDEILVVDSSSTDNSVEICKKHGAEVMIIPQDDFDHGGTRTQLCQKAKGEVVLFLTQDAIPTSRDAIEKLIQPLINDSTIATSYGRQLPDKHAGFPAAHLRGFNYPSKSIIRRYQDREQLGIKTIFTSNSFAAYRKTALAEVDYFKNGLIFGEDTCTVGRLLQRDYGIAYVAEAMVYHSHNYDMGQEFKRSFDIGVLHSLEADLFDDFGKAEKRGIDYVSSGLGMLRKKRQYGEMFDFMSRVVMKYLGYKIGRKHKVLPKSLVMQLSMHRNWWKS
ncbi:glycosyltransferase family 2 protein [Desulfopila sp. IMCC35008]|uniref:glycosyltransferase family 2 protein n=1 Tax=Desulfopila sp. IMCC35008 TaxID=2653858 RepID=UPI0013D7300A|nr:glycosyltransferase family 2 protein [Desulfopila sp. IMCC35008]